MSLRMKFDSIIRKRDSKMLDAQQQEAWNELVRNQQSYIAQHLPDSENIQNVVPHKSTNPTTPTKKTAPFAPKSPATKKAANGPAVGVPKSPARQTVAEVFTSRPRSGIFHRKESSSNIYAVSAAPSSSSSSSSASAKKTPLAGPDSGKKTETPMRKTMHQAFSPKRLSFFKKRDEDPQAPRELRRRPTLTGVEEFAAPADWSHSAFSPTTKPILPSSSQLNNTAHKQKKGASSFTKTMNSMSSSMGNIIKKADVRNVFAHSHSNSHLTHNHHHQHQHLNEGATHKVFAVELAGLMEYQRRDNRFKHIGIPIFLKRAIEYLKSYGLMEEGIFRVSPNHEEMQKLKERIDMAGPRFDFSFPFGSDKVALVAGVVKLYFRELPTALLPSWLLKAGEDCENDVETLKKELLSLPHAHYSTARELFFLLSDIAAHHDLNSMTASNLATVVAINVLPPSDMSQAMAVNSFVTFLIKNARLLFPTEEQLLAQSPSKYFTQRNRPSTLESIPSFSEMSEMQVLVFKGTMKKQYCKDQEATPKRAKVESSQHEPRTPMGICHEVGTSMLDADDDDFFEVDDPNQMFGVENADNDDEDDRLSVMALQFSQQYCHNKRPNLHQLQEALSANPRSLKGRVSTSAPDLGLLKGHSVSDFGLNNENIIKRAADTDTIDEKSSAVDSLREAACSINFDFEGYPNMSIDEELQISEEQANEVLAHFFN